VFIAWRDLDFARHSAVDGGRPVVECRVFIAAAVGDRRRTGDCLRGQVLLQIEDVVQLVVAVMFVEGQYIAAAVGIEKVVGIGDARAYGSEIADRRELVAFQKARQLRKKRKLAKSPMQL
jgi:hypothetical protein